MARSLRESGGAGHGKEFHVRLLGGFEVSVGGRVVEGEAWRLKRARALVKMLSLAPGHRLHRERVMDALWPRLGSASATNNLHNALHAARRAIGSPGCLRLDGHLLSLRPGASLRVDAEEFEAAAAEARRVREAGAYRAALEIYGGDLLPEDLYEEWAEERRAELRRTHLELLVELARLEEGSGNLPEAIEALRRVVEKEPLHEGANAALVRVYARAGWLAESVKQYRRFEESLRKEVGVEPGAGVRTTYREVLDGEYSLARASSPETPRHNLPAASTSFIGREREVEEVRSLLAENRLLTIIGSGGSGKTRLAVEAGRALVDEYEGGVWMVELADVSDAGLLAQEVSGSLGVHEQQFRPLADTLMDELRRREMLLILDNCERLVDEVASFVETMLGECLRLRVLATSREAIRVPEEVLWRVPPLSRSAAVRLFVERARRRSRDPGLGEEGEHLVAEICRRLDGLPLAIELAAARAGTLDVGQIYARLDDRFRLLAGGSRTAPPRQRTMWAAIEWSDGLLDEGERVLFERLSVFAGGWSLEAAEHVGVCGRVEAGEVMDLLPRLVDKSRVVAETGEAGGVRYGMLETIREYGRERLEESGEAERVRERHAEYYLALAEEAERRLTGPDQSMWLDRLEAEHDNFRAALAWTLGDERLAKLGLETASALWLFWDARGHLAEGRGWLERAVSMNPSRADAARAKALNGAGWMALYQGDHESAKRLLEESLTLYRKLGNSEGVVASLTNLGFLVAFGFRDDLPVGDLLEEAMSLRPEIRDHRVVGNLLVFAGLVFEAPEGGGRGMALHEESLALLGEVRDMRGVSTCLSSFGFMALQSGERDRAREVWIELINVSRELDKKICFALSYFGLASVAAVREDPARAARLWGAAETAGEATGVSIFPMARDAADYDALSASAREKLGEELFEKAVAEGKAMSQEEAIEYAMEPEEEPPDFAVLTRREKEVAALVADGHTNREIAVELSIAKRTVDNHVSSILEKLGLDSRKRMPTRMSELA